MGFTRPTFVALYTKPLGEGCLTHVGREGVAIELQQEKEVQLLKFLMRHYVFGNPALVGQQYGQRKVVKTLFQTLFEAATRDSHDRALIPVPFREELEELDVKKQKAKDDKRERARLVADIISSMTEQQALSLHHRLTGIAPGSILDLIIR
jgi:dGTPase